MHSLSARRPLAAFISLALTVALVSACGSGDDAAPAAPPEPTEPTEQQASEPPEQQASDLEALEQEQERLEQESLELELETERLEREALELEREALESLDQDLEAFEQDLERMMEAEDPEAALAELAELLGASDFSAFAADCELGATFAVGEGCHVVGVGHFYVGDDGWGVFDNEYYPNPDGTWSTASGNNSVSGPNNQFMAESNDDDTWTITALP